MVEDPSEDPFPGYGLNRKLSKSRDNQDEDISKTSMTWDVDGEYLLIDYFNRDEKEKKRRPFYLMILQNVDIRSI